MKTSMDNMEKIERTIKALAANNIDGYFAESHEQLADIIKSILPEGSSISCGGSVTLSESGAMDLMRSGYYNFLDRGKPGLTQEEIDRIYVDAHACDGFFTSTNAVTENGELYNVDGNGNRVSNIIHGPKKVIVVAGVNKIVKDIDEAVYRVKTVAAPRNGERLQTGTPCAATGKCICADGKMTEGCKCDKRMCIHYHISGFQRAKGRISVIFLNEELGY